MGLINMNWINGLKANILLGLTKYDIVLRLENIYTSNFFVSHLWSKCLVGENNLINELIQNGNIVLFLLPHITH